MCVQDPKSALTHFEHLREKYPQSTAVQYGLAKALDILAELNRSNVLLRRAISEYIKYLELGSKLNDTEFKLAAERCIERMRFIGNVERIIWSISLASKIQVTVVVNAF